MPILWSIEKPVALVVVHESVEVPPDVVEVGLAESVQPGIGAGGTMGNVHEPLSTVAAGL